MAGSPMPAAVHLIARLAAGGMRDAESMLDQLLSAAPERIDEATVRDLLGLADAEVVDTFVDHLVRGDGAAGVALLETLDERGRDVRALLDQAVDAIRAELIAGLADPAAVRHEPAALAAAGRRLAAIDPNRAGIGGLRFQLELAMFAPGAPSSSDAASVPTGSAAPSPAAQRPAAKPEPATPPVTPPAEAPATATPAPPAAPTRSTRGKETPAAIEAAAAAPAPTPTATADAADDDDRSDDVRARAPAAPTPAAPPEARAAPATAAATPTPADAPPTPAAPADARRLAEATPAAADPELEQLLAAWPAIVAQLSAHPPTKPLIVACRPVAVDGAIVTLGFPEEQAFLKDAAERRRPAIEAGIVGGARSSGQRPLRRGQRRAAAGGDRGRGRRLRARRGAPDLRRRPRRRRRGQLTAGIAGCSRRSVPAD